MSVKSSRFIVLLKSSISLLIFLYTDFWFKLLRGILKSPNIIVIFLFLISVLSDSFVCVLELCS